MAETSPVRGCMVIKPWGWGVWENLQRGLDGMFKATGHKNAYFPLLHSALSFLEKGSRTRRGVRQGVRRGDAPPAWKRGPTAAWCLLANWKNPWLFVRPAKRSSAQPVRQVDSVAPRPAALNQSMGKRRPVGDAHASVSCARPNFSGRKATPPTPPPKKRKLRRCRCSMSTPTSQRTGWRCQSCAERRPKANDFLVP